MKSQSQDSETALSVSFGEILKMKEKQLQHEQEMNASTAAVTLEAIHALSVTVPLALPEIRVSAEINIVDLQPRAHLIPSQASQGQMLDAIGNPTVEADVKPFASTMPKLPDSSLVEPETRPFTGTALGQDQQGNSGPSLTGSEPELQTSNAPAADDAQAETPKRFSAAFSQAAAKQASAGNTVKAAVPEVNTGPTDTAIKFTSRSVNAPDEADLTSKPSTVDMASNKTAKQTEKLTVAKNAVEPQTSASASILTKVKTKSIRFEQANTTITKAEASTEAPQLKAKGYSSSVNLAFISENKKIETVVEETEPQVVAVEEDATVPVKSQVLDARSNEVVIRHDGQEVRSPVETDNETVEVTYEPIAEPEMPQPAQQNSARDVIQSKSEIVVDKKKFIVETTMNGSDMPARSLEISRAATHPVSILEVANSEAIAASLSTHEDAFSEVEVDLNVGKVRSQSILQEKVVGSFPIEYESQNLSSQAKTQVRPVTIAKTAERQSSSSTSQSTVKVIGGPTRASTQVKAVNNETPVSFSRGQGDFETLKALISAQPRSATMFMQTGTEQESLPFKVRTFTDETGPRGQSVQPVSTSSEDNDLTIDRVFITDHLLSSTVDSTENLVEQSVFSAQQSDSYFVPPANDAVLPQGDIAQQETTGKMERNKRQENVIVRRDDGLPADGKVSRNPEVSVSQPSAETIGRDDKAGSVFTQPTFNTQVSDPSSLQLSLENSPIQFEVAQEEVTVAWEKNETQEKPSSSDPDIFQTYEEVVPSPEKPVSKRFTDTTSGGNQVSGVIASVVSKITVTDSLLPQQTLENLPIQLEANQQDEFVQARTTENQNDLFSSHEANIPPAVQVSEASADSIGNFGLSNNKNINTENIRSHTSTNSLNPVMKEMVGFEKDYVNVEQAINASSTALENSQISLRPRQDYETKNVDGPAGAHLTGSENLQTKVHVTEFTPHLINLTKAPVSSLTDHLPGLSNAHSENISVETVKTDKKNTTATLTTENLHPEVKETFVSNEPVSKLPAESINSDEPTDRVFNQGTLDTDLPTTRSVDIPSKSPSIEHETAQNRVMAEVTTYDEPDNPAAPIAKKSQPAVPSKINAVDLIARQNPLINNQIDAKVIVSTNDTNFVNSTSSESVHSAQAHKPVESPMDMLEAKVDFLQPSVQAVELDIDPASANNTRDDTNQIKVATDTVDQNISSRVVPQSGRVSQANSFGNKTLGNLAGAATEFAEDIQLVDHKSTRNLVDTQIQYDTEKFDFSNVIDLDIPTNSSAQAASNDLPDLSVVNSEGVNLGTKQNVPQKVQSTLISETQQVDMERPVFIERLSESSITPEELQTQTVAYAEETPVFVDQSSFDHNFVGKETIHGNSNVLAETVEPSVKASTLSTEDVQPTPNVMTSTDTTLVGEETELFSQPAIDPKGFQINVESVLDTQPRELFESQRTNPSEKKIDVTRAGTPESFIASQPDFDVRATSMTVSFENTNSEIENTGTPTPNQSSLPVTMKPELPNAAAPKVENKLEKYIVNPDKVERQDPAQATIASQSQAVPAAKHQAEIKSDSPSEMPAQNVQSIPQPEKDTKVQTRFVNKAKTHSNVSLQMDNAVSLQPDTFIKVDQRKRELKADQTDPADEKASPVEKQSEPNQVFGSSPRATNPLKDRTTVVAVEKDPAILVNAQDVEVVKQVLHQLNGKLKSGSTSMRLQLNPEELGAIEVEMIRDSQGVSVTFFAEQASTGKLLETQMGQLRQSLVDSGVQLSGLNIGQHSHPGQEGGFQHQNTNFAQPVQHGIAQHEVNPKATSHRGRATGQTSEVDYLI